MSSGLVQIVAAYANRPWYTTARAAVLMACSAGFALGAVARALTVDVFPIAIIDVAITVSLSIGAPAAFAIGLTKIFRPADIPSIAQILASEAARRAERDDPR